MLLLELAKADLLLAGKLNKYAVSVGASDMIGGHLYW